MGNDYRENTERLIGRLGGTGNILSVTNCMTRVRTMVRDEALVDEAGIRGLKDVMGLVHDRAGSYEIVVGPGKSKRYADQCHEMGLPAGGGPEMVDWKRNKEELKSGQKDSRIRSALKLLGDIFVPLIPGIITAGLCAGFAGLIAQIVPDYESIKAWNLIYNLLIIVNISFMTYLTAWAGYRAAERFGATPILGGMLGMITSLDGIDTIAKLLGLYDNQEPLNSILREGKGGVLAVIVGVFLLSVVEKKIRARMPESIDVIFTPLLTLLICAVPYILVIMPMFGYVSSGIVWVFSQLCLSSSVVVRIIAGYVSAALFLPLVATGMHHGMVALYSVQLQELGYITLYPALAMAGAGQVGAAIALWIKAKKVGNRELCSVIGGALPAGFLGIGEPLIYGVTLPLGRPFITAGLGAGFGGALVMAMEVASTTWGPSGILGVFVMTAGPCGAVKSALIYLAGLVISYICSFIITGFAYSEEELRPGAAPAGPEGGAAPAPPPESPSAPPSVTPESPMEAPSASPESSTAAPGLDASAYPTVKHGDPVAFAGRPAAFEYVITDPEGIHARPAGKLAELAGDFDCEVTLAAGGRSASARSPIEMMNLGATRGTKIKVMAEGREAGAAARAVRAFLEQTL